MASNAFFITESYLKANNPLSDNIDVKELYPHVKTAQDIYIQEGIGSTMYERLVESLTASPKNTTDDEVELLKKIREALAWYTAYEALPWVWVKIRNIGLVKQTGDNMEATSQTEMNHLRKELKNKADYYLKKVQDYLCCNKNLFPDYTCGGCDRCSSGPTKKGNSSAMAFESDLDCCIPKSTSSSPGSPFAKTINGIAPDSAGNISLNCEDLECEAIGYPIKTINGEGPDDEGNIDLSASDVGADPAGSAATAQNNSQNYTDNASANAYANAVFDANAHSDAGDVAAVASSNSYTDAQIAALGAKNEYVVLACSDETTAIVAGTGKATFRMPFAMTLTAVRASLTTAQGSGSIFTVDINEGGTSILSTKLTIDNNEKTSTTAATPAVISDASLADDAEITVDVDQIGTSGAKGLKIMLIGTR